MTNPHPLAALIAGVKRYPIFGNGNVMYEREVLAALEAATPPAIEKGGDAIDEDTIDARPATSPGVTAGAVPPDLVEAEEYEACLRREGDGLSVGAADTLRALIALATAQAAQIAALEAAPVPDLTDSVTVHANMLRGTIAKPTVDQIIHLYGREAFQPMIDAAVAKALEDACLAVSEHADWPEDEHGRTEQAGLFARGINAICAIAPAAPHVNETPKSEHDAGNVLTVPDLVEAAIAELQDVMRCRCDKAFTDRGMHDPDCQCDSQDALDTLIALATAQAAQIAALEAAPVPDLVEAGLTKERDELRDMLERAQHVVPDLYTEWHEKAASLLKGSYHD